MGKITNEALPDMQKTTSGFYQKAIEKVGVRGINQILPIRLKQGGIQNVTAEISSYCSLNSETKGINMSRITRTINNYLMDADCTNGFHSLSGLVHDLAINHKSPDVYCKAKFKMIFPGASPMSDLYSQEPCNISIETQFRNNEYKTFLTVESIEMSLCPCSKEMSRLVNNVTQEELELISALPEQLREKIEMSGYGAHNQKSRISVKVELISQQAETCWIEDLLEIIQVASSCRSFSVLKREDEKYVTEVSYMGAYIDDDKNLNKIPGAGPKFVEDIARDVAEALDETMLDRSIGDYVIVVNNNESIHSGDIEATSILSAGRNLK